jgi:uncharacterized membrane protein (UPF0127 family)
MAREALAPRLRRLPTTTVLGHEVPEAADLRARLLGLVYLDHDQVGAGLLIPCCSSVHTFGMRFVLDLVFLDAHREPISVRRGVPPRRLAWERRAAAVLELPIESALPALGPAKSTEKGGEFSRPAP